MVKEETIPKPGSKERGRLWNKGSKEVNGVCNPLPERFLGYLRLEEPTW